MNRLIQKDISPVAVSAHRAAWVPPVGIEGVTHFNDLFGEAIGELSADEIANGITLHIPSLTGYPGLPANGVLTLIAELNGERGVFVGEFQDGVIEFAPLFIPPETAAPLRGDTLRVHYYVSQGHDQLPGWVSQYRFCDLAPSTSALKVLGAIENAIDAQSAERGVTLSIHPCDAISAQDEVVVYVAGVDVGAMFVQRVAVADAQQPVLVDVPADVLLRNSNGTIALFYTVERSTQSVNGPLVTYAVEGAVRRVSLPSGVELSARRDALGVVGQTVTLTQPVSPALSVGARQTLMYWNRVEAVLPSRGYRLQSRQVEALDEFSLSITPQERRNSIWTCGWIEDMAGGVAATELAFMELSLYPEEKLSRLGVPDVLPSADFDLEAPRILEAEDDIVTQAAIDRGLTVQFRLPDEIPSGVAVWIYVQGYSHLSKIIRLATLPGNVVQAPLDAPTARLFRNQQVRISYQVYEEPYQGYSAVATYQFAVSHAAISIDGVPVIDHRLPEISVSQAQSGVSLVLPLTAAQALGQVVTFYGGGSGPVGAFVTPVPLTQAHLDQGFVRHEVGAEYLVPHLGGWFVASYVLNVLGREVEGPASRYTIEALVPPLTLDISYGDSERGLWFDGEPIVQVSPYLRMAVGDRVTLHAELNDVAPISNTYWRQEQVITEVGLPLFFTLPDEFAEQSSRPRVQVFVIRANSGEVSGLSELLVRIDQTVGGERGQA